MRFDDHDGGRSQTCDFWENARHPSRAPPRIPSAPGSSMLIKRGIPVSPGVVSGPASCSARTISGFPSATSASTPWKPKSPASSRPSKRRLRRNLRERATGDQPLWASSTGRFSPPTCRSCRIPRSSKKSSSYPRPALLPRIRLAAGSFAATRRCSRTWATCYLADRADDIFDLEKRILRHLLGERREELMAIDGAGRSILAHNLTPGRDRNPAQGFVLGFATRGRGPHEPHGHSGRGAGDSRRRRRGGFPVRRRRRRNGRSSTALGARSSSIPTRKRSGHYRDSQARLKTVVGAAQVAAAAAVRRPRTASASCSWATSNSPRKSSIAPSAAPTGSGSTGPSSFTCKAAASRPRRTISPPIAGW